MSLPSFLRKRQSAEEATPNIVCLPRDYSSSSAAISIPRGKKHVILFVCGEA